MYSRGKDIECRTRLFVKEILKSVKTFPRSVESQVVTKQIIRSSCSIGANLAEASAARSRLEFGSILGISLKEAQETRYWIETAYDFGLITITDRNALLEKLTIVANIIAAIIKKARIN